MHPMLGATGLVDDKIKRNGISINAPRAGCDWYDQGKSMTEIVFQSTHPVRGARNIANSSST